MNILLTNDDGIAAPGLWAAARALAEVGQVTILAPTTNYSGYGAALPPSRSFSYFPYRHPDGQPRSVTAYALAGTPANCVHIGLCGTLAGPFDLVVSGINHGANLGRDVFYSGTVGAALTAHLLGVPAIAISLDVGPADAAYWETAAWALGVAMRLWQTNPPPTAGAGSESVPVILNVNAPNLPFYRLRGMMITTPADTSCLTRYHFGDDPHAGNTLVVSINGKERPPLEPWTDVWAVEQGYVAITPLRAFPDLLCVVPWDISPATLAMPLLSAAEVTRAPDRCELV